MSATPNNSVLACLDEMIAALTCAHVEQHFDDGSSREGDAVPLLERSIGHDLVRIEKSLGGSQTLLSAIAVSIDEALLAAQSARSLIVGAQRSNVRTAPLFMQESTVRSIVQGTPTKSTKSVPILGKLVDQPKPSAEPAQTKITESSEPARVAPKLATATSPVEPRTVDRRGEPSAEQAKPRSVALPPAAEKPRRSDVAHRQAKDRDAKALEAPVDRIATIREAAQRAQAHRPARPARQRTPVRASAKRAEAKAAPKVAKPLPPLGVEQRKARFAAAEAFLKRQCILVTVVNRDALIRTYRVSGKQNSMLADGVVELALSMGMPEPESTHG